MNAEMLQHWYKTIIGYDPFADGATYDEVVEVYEGYADEDPEEALRRSLLATCQRIDPNGCHIDEDCYCETGTIATAAEAVAQYCRLVDRR